MAKQKTQKKKVKVESVGQCHINATFNNLKGLAFYQGSLYISDSGNYRVRKVVLSTPVITTVAGGGSGGDGQVATDASLNAESVAFDPSGNMFISGGQVIRRVDALTRIISTIASRDFGGGAFTSKTVSS
jgi:hypothetical protein